MQLAHGRDQDGAKMVTAFDTSSFQLGKGPEGKTVLTLTVGKTGNISFLLPSELQGQLFDALGKLHMN